MPPTIDIEGLGFDAGAHLLVKHALLDVAPGAVLRVRGSAPGWDAQLAAWCRGQGHACEFAMDDGRLGAAVTRSGAVSGRWRGALASGHADPARAGAVAEQAAPRWGLAARGATVEAGAPEFHFRLDQKSEVW
ncbi:MAG: ferritin-like domain-containing protein, partial [Massilia sp.]